MSKKVMIIEDEETLRMSLERVLSREGYDVTGADSAETALDIIGENFYDLILVDVILPGITGIEFLKRVKERYPDQIIVIMTAFASLETAVESLRAGAYDYIIKPVMHEEIKQVVKNAMRQRTLQEENLRLKKMLRSRYDVTTLIARSSPMKRLMDEIDAMKTSDNNILILGEIGTGKELIARTIHASSSRSDGPFIVLNSRDIPLELFEKSVFGISGDRTREKGLLEEANDGTLFIREICDLTERQRDMLLSVFEKGEVTIPGSETSMKINMRLIAASMYDPTDQWETSKMPRCRVLRVPPLRERQEDIEDLARHFIKRFSSELCKDIKGIDDDAIAILRGYPWPGNVRELQNVIERAVLLSEKDYIGREEVVLLIGKDDN